MKRAWYTSFAVCGAALLLAACQPPAGAGKAPAQTVAAGAPGLEELKSATYSGLEDLPGPVTLADGRWEGEPFAPGGASRPSVTLAPGFRLTGDLDGDLLFGLTNFDAAAGRSVMDTMVTDKFSFPGALQWKGVSDLVTAVFGGDGGRALLANSILWSMAIAGFAALVMEVLRIRTHNRFPLSPLAIGLGVVVPPDSSFMMFMGAALFWLAGRSYGARPESRGYRLWVDAQEPICAGLIAGAALIGIGDILVKVFVFG